MKILLLGCGNLGKALLEAWVNNGVQAQIMVVQPSLSAQPLFDAYPSVTFCAHVQDIPPEFTPDIIVIAVKPQRLPTLLPSCVPYCQKALVVSLAAGVSVSRLTVSLKGYCQIVRIMPNVAVKIGESVNLAYSNLDLSFDQQKQLDAVFGITGKMVWLEKEELIDILTPISGSGPAYFFLLAETLTQITITLGLKEDLARELVQQTFLGSALLTARNPSFEQMMASVASKGGVTEAALQVLRPGLPGLLSKALEAAATKVKELNG